MCTTIINNVKNENILFLSVDYLKGSPFVYAIAQAII